jgi:hypothetical protein
LPFFHALLQLETNKQKKKNESSQDLLVQICQTSLEPKKERRKQHAKPKSFIS